MVKPAWLRTLQRPEWEAIKMISARVSADELNLPVEIARKLKGKKVTISEIGDGFLLKPISEDPINDDYRTSEDASIF
jgi:hypothetical protein